jgi:hypothetical protein
VDAKCYACTATWRTANVSHALSFDQKRNYVYTTMAVDGGAAFATLNACTGDVIAARTPAKSKVGIDPLPSINELVPLGAHLFTRGDCAPGAMPQSTCVYRYDAVSNTVDMRGQIPTSPDAGDEVWSITALTSGKLFASGKYGATGMARIVPLAADLSNCGGATVAQGKRGGAIGSSGDDVYQVLYTGTPGQVRLAHFVGASCATAGPCGCAPADVSPTLTLPIASPNPEPSTYFLLIQSGIVYVVGFQSVQSGAVAGAGFIAAFDTKANQWTPAYVYSPSNYGKLDGLIKAAITPDGKLLYVVGAKAALDPASTGVLLRFDLPFSVTQAPTPNGEITVPGMKVVWDVTVTADAVYVGGDDAQVGKCSLALACKN